MEALNYVAGAHNMILTEDAQIVTGVSGNACYLPIGTGKMRMDEQYNELSISLWREWDGVVDTQDKRGIFSLKNLELYFDSSTDFLTIVCAGVTTVTDIKDEQKQAHWCVIYQKGAVCTVYKNAHQVAQVVSAQEPADCTGGFTLGGGRTHATFDEIRLYKAVLQQAEINGLYYLISKGVQVKQVEDIASNSTPKCLGVTETVANTQAVIIVKGEKLGIQQAHAGDWVLMSKTVGGWKAGICYRWTGAMWINLEPEYNYEAQYQACLYHICEIPELVQNTGHYGALFAKLLVAQEAFIKKLVTDQAFLKELVVQRLKIDSDKNSDKDFEAWFDAGNGLRIKNNGDVIFWVEPGGNASFYGISFKKEGSLKKYRFEKPDHDIVPTKNETLWYGEKEAENVTIKTWEATLTVNVFVKDFTHYIPPSIGEPGMGRYIPMLTLRQYHCKVQYKKSTILLKNGEKHEDTIQRMEISSIGGTFDVEKEQAPSYQFNPPQPYDYGEYKLHEVKIILNTQFKNLLIIDNIPSEAEVSINALPKGTLYKGKEGFIKIT